MSNDKPVTIHELIGRFTPAQIAFQRLDESLGNVTKTKDGSRVTFYTNQIDANSVVRGDGKMGLILWVSKKDWNRVVKELKP